MTISNIAKKILSTTSCNYVVINNRNIVVEVVSDKQRLAELNDTIEDGLQVVKWNGIGAPLKVKNLVCVWEDGCCLSYHGFHKAYLSLKDDFRDGRQDIQMFQSRWKAQHSKGFYEPAHFWTSTDFEDAKFKILGSLTATLPGEAA